MQQERRSINIVVAALGGEGGGVFSNWVIDVAQASGWQAQSTQLAGVAQRTGATIYYIEIFDPSEDGAVPVMSLFPTQGDLDLVITTEIAEAGRMLTRGFVSPDRTTLITSSHRVFGITEKVALADGTIDTPTILNIAGEYAKQFLCYDMAKIAQKAGALVSSALLGGLAGSGVLPYSKEAYIQVIENTGIAVAPNVAAFEASYDRARSGGVEEFDPSDSDANEGSQEAGYKMPAAATPAGQAMLDRAMLLPVSVHELAYHGLKRLADYQDVAYADGYLTRLANVADADDGRDEHQLTQKMARYLSLWMGYEDVPRVAQLKTREGREGAIREEVKADPDQIISVTEFFSPRVEEVAAMMPKPIGKLMLTGPMTKIMNVFMGGRKLRTNTVSIFAMLRMMAGMRRWRRSSLGFEQEMRHMNRWQDAVLSMAGRDLDAAIELAECGRIVKGYGDTRHRLLGQLSALLDGVADDTSAADVAEGREQALASDSPEA